MAETKKRKGEARAKSVGSVRSNHSSGRAVGCGMLVALALGAGRLGQWIKRDAPQTNSPYLLGGGAIALWRPNAVVRRWRARSGAHRRRRHRARARHGANAPGLVAISRPVEIVGSTLAKGPT